MIKKAASRLLIIAICCSLLGGALVRAAPEVGLKVSLTVTDVGKTHGLTAATGSVVIDKGGEWVVFTVKLPQGYTIPDKTVFEGWLTAAGTLGADAVASTSLADEKFGPRYANRTLATLSETIPYVLTAGALQSDGKGNLTTALKWPNYNFAPYKGVMITAETDGNERPWDPRPGATIMTGKIADAVDSDPVDIDQLVKPMPDMNQSQVITLKLTKLGEAAGLKSVTGKAFVLTEAGAADVRVTFPATVKLPEGAVLEAFIVDGGTLGNFKPTHVHQDDKQWGPSFNNPYLSGIAAAIPFATSLGGLKDDGKGVYSLQIHWPKYPLRVYDVLMVTLEADGDQGSWNPRPGTPVLVGTLIADTDLSPLLAMPSAEDMKLDLQPAQ